MRISRPILSTPFLVAAAALTACTLQKNPPSAVLRSEDFIADPTAAPTDQRAGIRPATAAQKQPHELSPETAPTTTVSPPPPQISVLAAQDDAFDLAATPGEPMLAGPSPEPAAAPVFIDAKLGELNGRPVRVQEMLDEVGPRLASAARSRQFTPEEWKLLGLQPQTRSVTRDEWLRFARTAFSLRLESILEDELLQAEGRASLRPEQQQGLRYMVQEFGQQERRKHGGSQAELARSLREGAEPKTEQQIKREREAALLIGFQLEERIRKRVRVSWKDVRLWYERNYETFNPPATATFRMIQVPADRTEALARVQAALGAGTPFIEVARSEDNTNARENAGLWGTRQFTGEYKDATLFNEPLNTAARSLTPGNWTGPIDFSGTKAFLYLESIEQTSRPLSDPHVQLAIANFLNNQAFDNERKKYIAKLKERASYSPIEQMAERLTQIAAARYWPR